MPVEIIRMALEAGLIHAQDADGQWDGITNQQLFGYPYENPCDQEWAEKRMVEILKPFAAIVAAYEREACAKVCEELVKGFNEEADNSRLWCAAAIRARSSHAG